MNTDDLELFAKVKTPQKTLKKITVQNSIGEETAKKHCVDIISVIQPQTDVAALLVDVSEDTKSEILKAIEKQEAAAVRAEARQKKADAGGAYLSVQLNPETAKTLNDLISITGHKKSEVVRLAVEIMHRYLINDGNK